jgi:twinkle protein
MVHGVRGFATTTAFKLREAGAMKATEIKDALRERVDELAHYLFPAGVREGTHWCVGDVTGTPGKSLKICLTGDKAGLWGDFADSQNHSRSLIDLWMQARNVDFKTALREAAQWLGVTLAPPAGKGTKRMESAESADDFLSKADCLRAIKMAETLRETPNLCERVAQARGWKPETIRGLSREPSLGWHEGKLAFIYESGVKLRWRQQGERIVRWAFGKPWLWRGSYIDIGRTVYLCEGETDAISLIDAGLESDGQMIAVALPSASTFNERWAALFTRKDVVLVFDADRAGEQAMRRISRYLQPHVTSLKQLNWGGLRHAS